MLPHLWDEGLDVCVDRTWSSHLTQIGMVDFVLDRVVIDAAERKGVKYKAKFAYIGYGFLPFSFSSFGKLEKDARTMTDYERDHAVSCAGIIGIEHRHNVVCDTLVDICYRSEISGGLDVRVDLTGSSPLTQTGMDDFAPGRAVIDAAQHKRVKYEAKCTTIGYGFLPFSFSSLGELEEDAVTLLKRI
ncbi:hypothetical protein Tco_1138283 [Tanacetum coccineum]